MKPQLRTLVVLPVLLTLCQLAAAQANYSTATITVTPDSRYANAMTFEVTGLPDLKNFTVPGAPQAYHTFLWVFSDGTFSRDARPRHVFPGEGSYRASLYLSGKYSTGGPPPAMRTTLTVGPGNMEQVPKAGTAQILRMEANHQLAQTPQVQYSVTPSGQNILLLEYGNVTGRAISAGKLFLCYNESDRPIRDFGIDTVETFAGEQAIVTYTTAQMKSLAATYPAGSKARQLLSDAADDYQDVLCWNTSSMDDNTDNLLAVTFDCSSDTALFEGNTLHYDAIWLPDAPMTITSDYGEQIPLESRRSHDPNRIEVSRKKAVFCNGKHADSLVYTIYFENEGNGPASRVVLQHDLPKPFKLSDIRVVSAGFANTTPDSLPTPYLQDDKVTWKFEPILLPGSGEASFKNDGSNKGFVCFAVAPSHKYKRSLVQQAEIIFDRNEAIKTNRAKTRLMRNHRIGFSVGALVHDVESGALDFGGVSANNVFAHAFTTPMRHGRIFRQHAAGIELMNYTIRSTAEGHPDSLWQFMRVMATPLRGGMYAGPFQVDVGLPLQVALSETIDGQNVGSGLRWGAGVEAGFAWHPHAQGWHLRAAYRYGLTTELGHRNTETLQLLMLGTGWSF